MHKGNGEIMKTIFVVDDSDVNLIQAKRALEGHFHIRTMPSADKMLKIILKFVPDLILLDIEMPEMNGFEAIQKLKETEQTRHIPVIFLTASMDNAIEAKGLELGAADFVTKPFSAPVLLNRIAHHLQIEELLKKHASEGEDIDDKIIAETGEEGPV
jgi:putative two-component system response regulator